MQLYIITIRNAVCVFSSFLFANNNICFRNCIAMIYLTCKTRSLDADAWCVPHGGRQSSALNHTEWMSQIVGRQLFCVLQFPLHTFSSLFFLASIRFLLFLSLDALSHWGSCAHECSLRSFIWMLMGQTGSPHFAIRNTDYTHPNSLYNNSNLKFYSYLLIVQYTPSSNNDYYWTIPNVIANNVHRHWTCTFYMICLYSVCIDLA